MSAVQDTTIIANSTAQGCASGGPVGCAAGAIKGAIQSAISELAQHTARLKDAKNENTALDALIPAFDLDITGIAAAFNAGDITRDDAIGKLQTVDAQTEAYLFGLVGKPGTAWGGPRTQQIGNGINATYPAPCDKRCTAGCCVYLNSLRPAIYGRNVSAGGPSSYAPWRTGDNVTGLIEAISNGVGQVKVIDVFPPPNKAYGSYGRKGYVIPIQATFAGSSAVGTAVSSVTDIVDKLFGGSPQPPTPGNGIVTPFTAPIQSSSSLTGFALLAALFIGAVLLVARLMR
jgi:hypothetical protein